MRPKSSLAAPEIREILSQPQGVETIKEIFLDFHPHDIFVLCEGLKPEENAKIIMALGRPQGIEFFQEFNNKQKNEIFSYFSKEWMADVLEDMAPDERADFIKTLPKERIEEILPLVAQAERNDIKKLIQYEEGTAGSILTTEYAALPPDITTKEALEKLKLQAFDRETIYYVYVIDSERKLLGFVSLKDILVADPYKRIKDIMSTHLISCNVNEDKEVVARKLSDYDLLAIPVTDNENRLVGIVTVDDVLDVLEDEDTEDFQKLGAINVRDAGLSFITDLRDTSIFRLYRSRVTWLIILLLMDLCVGGIISKFGATIAKYIVLVTFLPVLVDTAGNAGSQAATLMVRALALGNVKLNDWLKLLGKEFLVSGALGITMGIGISIMGIVRGGIAIATVVVVTMMVNVVIGSVIGMSLPFLFTRFKKDPATASTPLITTLADIIGTLIYLLIAVAFLGT